MRTVLRAGVWDSLACPSCDPGTAHGRADALSSVCFRPTIVQHSKLPGSERDRPEGQPGLSSGLFRLHKPSPRLQRPEDARGPSWSLNAHLPTLSQQRRAQGTSELPPPPSRQASGRMEKKRLPQLEQEDRASAEAASRGATA